MSKSKLGEGSTLGPWHITKQTNGALREHITCFIADNERNALAYLVRNDEPNARLIAKAPLLVECRDALRYVLPFFEMKEKDEGGCVAYIREIRALLAKLEDGE